MRDIRNEFMELDGQQVRISRNLKVNVLEKSKNLLANNNVTILSSTHCSAPSAWPLKSNIIGFSQFWRKLLIFRTRNIYKIERPFIK